MYPDPQLIPIAKADIEGTSASTGIDILATALTASRSPSMFHIDVSTAVAAKFKANITVDSTEYTRIFNAGVDLVADCSYMFDMLVHSGDSVNFEFDDNCTGIFLRVQEICYGG